MCMIARSREFGLLLSLGVVVSFWMAVPASADIFHLSEGGVIEGEVVEESEDMLKIRTTLGVFEIEKSRIEKREAAPAPWEHYDKKLKDTPDTADGHYELARWCGRSGLYKEQKKHLKKAVAIDPDHLKARVALGEVKVEGKWVKNVVKPKNAPTPEELEAMRKAKRDEKIARKAIAEWHVKITAIHRGRLEGEGWFSDKFQNGRQQILEIKDPFAIPPITKVLSQGGESTRRLMVEALAQFEEDESTMNLIVVAVLDASPQIRSLAVTELISRNDPRVIEELRGALAHEEEFVLRNAADALGALKAKSAVGDLIPLLSTVDVQRVRVSQPVFLDSVYGTFGCARPYFYRGSTLFYQPQYIGVIGPAYPMGMIDYFEDQLVTVHRTEVQEALISITGQNFGFDDEAGRRWWRRNKDG